MNLKKTILISLFYFIIIGGVFFISKYFILEETENIKDLATQSVVSGLLGTVVLTYMLRRWANKK